MTSLDQLTRLKQNLEQAGARAQQLKGQVQATKDRLKEEFGVAGLPAAEKKLQALTSEASSLLTERDEAVEGLRERYASKISQ
ncbi:MAG: hypothetical protein KKD77_23420 [Gammaproteobacteria bacterium]|nr:hypothetical protein [Gammaproteobacteria bacterium]